LALLLRACALFFAAKQSGNTPFDTVQIPAAMVAEKSGFNFF
jgi:hypothetical protein